MSGSANPVRTGKAVNVLPAVPGQSGVFCRGCFPVAHWPRARGPYDELSSGRDS